VIARLLGVIGESLHCLLQLNVGLSSGQDLFHPSDIVLQVVLIQGVRDLHPANKRECKDVLIIVGDLDQLAVEVADVRFEAAALPHFDSEKMVIVPLSLQARCELGEERLGHLLEIVKILRRQGIEPI